MNHDIAQRSIKRENRSYFRAAAHTITQPLYPPGWPIIQFDQPLILQSYPLIPDKKSPISK